MYASLKDDFIFFTFNAFFRNVSDNIFVSECHHHDQCGYDVIKWSESILFFERTCAGHDDITENPPPPVESKWIDLETVTVLKKIKASRDKYLVIF